MLKRKTPFVIGAGTGVGINMPVGDDLSESIAKLADINFREGDQVLGSRTVTFAIRQSASKNKMDPNTLFAAGRAIAGGIRHFKSVDNFLYAHNHNENVEHVGKLAIVEAILTADRDSHLFIEHEGAPSFRREDQVRSSWLHDFAFVLAEDAIANSTLDSIFDNLRVINFNYDRCIEHFLFWQLQKMYPYNGAKYFADLLRSKLKITRPYGSVGELPWRLGNVRFGCDNFDDLVVLSQRILTYSEQVTDSRILIEVDELVEWADVIVFLGFHFHKQNMELLIGKRGVSRHCPDRC
jgi:hypothetical protein